MKKWWLKVDWISGRNTYIVFIAYLVVLSIMNRPYITSVGWTNNSLQYNNSFYFYYQYIVFVFISEITVSVFHETYKEKSSTFIKTLNVPVFEIVWKRIMILYVSIAVFYLPLVVNGVYKINQSIFETVSNNELFNGISYQFIDWKIPFVHCAIALLFCITVNIFLLTYFRNKKTVMMIVLSYCVMEAGPFHVILGKYALFSSAFTSPDFFSYFTANIIIQIVLICVMSLCIGIWAHRIF